MKNNSNIHENIALCVVCKSNDSVEFLTITNCNLCQKCRDELSDSFDEVMMIGNRNDFPEY